MAASPSFAQLVCVHVDRLNTSEVYYYRENKFKRLRTAAAAAIKVGGPLYSIRIDRGIKEALVCSTFGIIFREIISGGIKYIRERVVN